MNNKAFTTVELILTMLLVVIIMGTITSVTYTYRDRSTYEKLVSDINDYKNTTTKIIYDDILDVDKVVSIEQVDNYNFNLITESDNTYLLTIIDNDTSVGINYRGVNYLFPGSDDNLVSFDGIEFKNQDNLYKLDIIFSHRNLEDSVKLHFVIS